MHTDMQQVLWAFQESKSTADLNPGGGSYGSGLGRVLGIEFFDS